MKNAKHEIKPVSEARFRVALIFLSIVLIMFLLSLAIGGPPAMAAILLLPILLVSQAAPTVSFDP